jgi:hypothetical protein
MTDQRLSDQLRFLCRDRLAYEQLQVMLAAQQEMAEFLLDQQKQQLEQQHQLEIENFLGVLEEEKREFVLLLSYAVRGPLRQVLDMTQLLMHEELSYQQHDWLYTLGRSANRLVQVFHEAAGDLDIDLPEQIQLRLPMLGGGMPLRAVAAAPRNMGEVTESSIDAMAVSVNDAISEPEPVAEIISESIEVIILEPEIIESEPVSESKPVAEIISESIEVIISEPEIAESEPVSEPEPVVEIISESIEVTISEPEITELETISEPEPVVEIISESIEVTISEPEITELETISEPEPVVEIISESIEVTISEPEITELETISEPEPVVEIISESIEVIISEPEIIESETISEPEPIVEIISQSAEVTTSEPEITATEIISNADESVFPILEPEFMKNIINIAGKGKPAIEFLLEVIAGYINEAPDHMDSIRKAYTDKNIGQFVRSICFLRTDAEYLGGLELSHMCRRIEVKLEQEYPFPWHKISLPALEKCFNQTYIAIKQAHEYYKSLL